METNPANNRLTYFQSTNNDNNILNIINNTLMKMLAYITQHRATK